MAGEFGGDYKRRVAVRRLSSLGPIRITITVPAEGAQLPVTSERFKV